MALVPIGGGRDDLYRRALQQQLMNQNLQSATSIAGTIGGQRERQAFGDMLTGKPAALDPGVASLDIMKSQGGPAFTPAVPGFLETGKLTPQMAQAFMLQGGNPAQLAALMPKQAEGFTLGPDQVRYSGTGQELAKGPAGQAKPPQTRDVLQGQERVFQQYDPATGQWIEVGRGPAFAPPTQINLGDQAKLSDIGAFRKQFMTESGDFSTLREQYGRLRTIVSQPPSPAGDLALTFSYMKILDPPSIVREGEQATVQNAAGVPERIRNAYNAVLSGQTLTPEQRADFARSAHAIYQESATGQRERQEQSQRIAANTMPNYNPADIVPDLIGRAAEWQEPVIPPPAPPPPTMVEQGVGAWEQFKDIIGNELGSFFGGGTEAAPTAPPPPVSTTQMPAAGQVDFSAEIEASRKRIEELKRKLGRP